MPTRKRLPLLSKTRYMPGTQCDKRLYLDCHRHDLIPEVSVGQQRLFDQGHEVGVLTTCRYPGGVRIEFDRSQYAEAAAATVLAMADASVPAIFEPAFEYAGVRIRVDILVRLSGGWWRVEEVKSSTKFDESVHLGDLAVQPYVLDSCGVRVSEAGILHIDRENRRAMSLATRVSSSYGACHMAKHDGLEDLVTDFVHRLRGVIRQQALEAVQDSLSGGGGPRPKAATNGHRKGLKRDAGALEALQDKVESFIAKHPGLRIEEINKQLRTNTKDLQLPIRKLIAAKAIKTTGAKRSTKYFMGGKKGKKGKS